MKIKIFALLVTVISVTAKAQLPKWVIEPTNDSLFVKIDDTLIQGQRDGISTIWDMDGRQLYSTENTILPFKDDMAVVRMTDQPIITGFIDKKGNFINIKDAEIAYDNPYFDDGYILCKKGSKLVFYKKDGSEVAVPKIENVYPYHKGYAPYFTYDKFEKKKDPHYGYLTDDGRDMSYSIIENGNNKTVDPKDITFASGISPNGNGVAVIKNKLYWFDASTGTFVPFLYGEESAKKRHLTLNGDYEHYFLNLPKDTVIITAKYGKNQIATLKFDKELRPVLFSFDDQDMQFGEEPTTEYVYKTGLSVYEESGKYGLKLNAVEVLPVQFDNVGLRYGNRVFVKKDGKWGVIEIIPGLDYSMHINNGEDIAFRHQRYKTQIRLDLPSQISAKEARIYIPEETGCLIDKTSRTSKDTESGNYVIYDCMLNIPSSLPDTITTINYRPVKVSYEGISLFDRDISVKGWHYKYYNVDPIDSETSISNGVASFTINIVKEGESDYPFDVRIEADSISVDYEKISETRYKCLVSNLQEGNNNLNIYVTEKGCPPSIFPFEIFYTKPVSKKKETEGVVIRKKAPAPKKQTPRLEL